MKIIDRIFIVGQPGAGKGLLAKTLAKELNWKFIDADLGLELHVGLSLQEILGQKGTESYAECLLEIIKSLTKKKAIVVATDGYVLGHENCLKILENEFVVHLKVGIDTQRERFEGNSNPILNRESFADLLMRLHKERDTFFDIISNCTVNSDDNFLDKHVITIKEKLNMFQLNKCDNLNFESSDAIFLHQQTFKSVKLTNKQFTCLQLLSEGQSYKKIAKVMGISHRTVEEHVSNIMKTLGCSSSGELIALYHSKK